MQLQENVMTCVQERVLNKTENGRVFDSDEDHLKWLFGSESDCVEGFLADPASALSKTIERVSEDSRHEGVALTDDENAGIREVISSLNFGNISAQAATGSTASAMATLFFLGPNISLLGGY